MLWERGQRPLAYRVVVLAGFVLMTLGESCSPSGGGSTSVLLGKNKLKAVSKNGSVNPKAGPVKHSQTIPRGR
jgi:hypothetical protein